MSEENQNDTPEELTLEKRMGRLEKIVGALEGGELPLDQAMALFEEGIGHIRHAEKLLTGAQLKVEELIRGAEGEEGLQPFQDAEGAE